MEISGQTNKASILKLLREKTRVQHEAIEKNPLTSSIVSGEISSANYRLLLAKFHGFHFPLEVTFAQFSDWLHYDFDIDARRKSPLLHRDLLALGYTPSEVALLPTCSKLPLIQSFAQALGVLYVLEGSMLGGQILYQHIHQKFNYDKDHGLTYFHGYGKQELKSKWMELKALLETFYLKYPDNQDIIIESAAETFSKLDTWLKTIPQ